MLCNITFLTKVIFITFAGVARGLGGRDENKNPKYQQHSCYAVRSPSDIPERYPG